MSAPNLNLKAPRIRDKANNILAYDNWHIICIFFLLLLLTYTIDDFR
jgi:hypothetical protein